jgi:hypothetical protein
VQYGEDDGEWDEGEDYYYNGGGVAGMGGGLAYAPYLGHPPGLISAEAPGGVLGLHIGVAGGRGGAAYGMYGGGGGGGADDFDQVWRLFDSTWADIA